MTRNGAAATPIARAQTPAIGLSPEMPPVVVRKSVPLVVARWIAIGVCFLFVLELTCRVEDWVMYRIPILSRYTSLEDLVVRDADGMHGRPNARYQKWVMNTLGMRGPPASVAPAPNAVRIVTVGASETFGLMESAGREYPRQLEDSLTRRAPAVCQLPLGGSFEVLNAGFAGMGIPTIDQDVRTRLQRLKPDIIVVYPSAVAYLEEQPPSAARPDSSGRSAEASLATALQPRVLARLRQQIKQIIPAPLMNRLRKIQTDAELRGQPADWRFTSIPSDRLMRFDRDLRHLVATIRAAGAIPILVTHANVFMGRHDIDAGDLQAWEKFYPRATGSTLIAFDSAARASTLAIGADLHVPVVDAARQLALGPPEAFGDMVHFTDAGASEMADALANEVLSVAQSAGHCGTRAGVGASRRQP
jgi:hypothetical protein